MSVLVGLRYMPVDFYNLLHMWLDLDATARLHATFDKRIQYLVRVSRLKRVAEINLSSDGQHWHILYFLNTVNDFETIHLGRHADLSFEGLGTLTRLNPARLILDTHSVCTLSKKDPSFSYSMLRHVLLGFPGAGTKTTYTSHPIRLSIRNFFPRIQHLSILTPIVSVLSVPKGSTSSLSLEEHILTDFALNLPVALQSLHCANFSIDSRIMLRDIWLSFPKTLTDVRMATKCSSDSVSLSDYLLPLPQLQTLRLSLSASAPIRWNPWPLTQPFPTSLTDLQISIHSSELIPSLMSAAFPWVDSNIILLSLVGEPAVPKRARPATDLKPLLPKNLVELHLTESLIRNFARDLTINSLPPTLTSLYLGSTYIDSDLTALLAYLPHLQLLSAALNTRPVKLPDWQFLQRNLTTLELKNYTMTSEEILQLPTNLTRLQCHVDLLEDVLNILTRCPNVSFFCDNDIYLSHLNMAQILNFGLESLECVTSFAILDHLIKFCGYRCTINFAFERSASRLMPSDWLTLSPSNKALILESYSAHTRNLSLDNSTFELSLVRSAVHLQRLEYQSRAEISSLRFCPPNLTSLNLRRSPIKAGITLRDMPQSLTSFTSLFETTMLLTAKGLPPTHQLRVLDTPCLVYDGEEIGNAISDEAEMVRARISWMYDKDVTNLLSRWSKASLVELQVIVKPTGHLVQPDRNFMDFTTLDEDSRAMLTKFESIKKVETIPPNTIYVPPHITTVNFLSCTTATRHSLAGIDNDVLPNSLTHLEIRLGRMVRDLFPKLPPTLLFLHIETENLCHDYAGPFPSQLQTLILGVAHSAKTTPYVPFWLSALPVSLKTLTLIHCQPKWRSPLTKDAKLSNLLTLSLPHASPLHLDYLRTVAPMAQVVINGTTTPAQPQLSLGEKARSLLGLL